MTDSICYTCRHFRQTAPLSFTVSGHCGWTSTEALPEWLVSYLETDDIYGPRRDVGRGAYARSHCGAHVAAADHVIDKRHSEAWYD